MLKVALFLPHPYKNPIIIFIIFKSDDKPTVAQTHLSQDILILDRFHKIPFLTTTLINKDNLKKDGISFDKAYKLFKNFVEDNVCYSHSWDFAQENDADGEVMREMLNVYGIIDEMQPKYQNIAPWFRDKYKENGIRVEKQSSGEIATILGKEDELKELCLQVHNAFYDVYSILIGLRILGF